MRSGQIRHVLLYLLIPIVMLTGIFTVNSIGARTQETFARMMADAPEVLRQICLLEDFPKMCFLVMGAVAGTLVGLIFKIENDVEFAKKNYIRRFTYVITSLLTTVCVLPYLLMRYSDDRPKYLCFAAAFVFAAMAWIIIEISYPRLKGYVVILLDKFLPIPKGPDNAAVPKDQKPPAQ